MPFLGDRGEDLWSRVSVGRGSASLLVVVIARRPFCGVIFGCLLSLLMSVTYLGILGFALVGACDGCPTIIL